MMKPGVPEAETKVIKMAVGYGWSFSYEHGPSGSRQKIYISGNVEGMARAMTELRRAKISLMELAAATVEELARPPPYEGFSERDREDRGEDLLY